MPNYDRKTTLLYSQQIQDAASFVMDQMGISNFSELLRVLVMEKFNELCPASNEDVRDAINAQNEPADEEGEH